MTTFHNLGRLAAIRGPRLALLTLIPLFSFQGKHFITFLEVCKHFRAHGACVHTQAHTKVYAYSNETRRKGDKFSLNYLMFAQTLDDGMLWRSTTFVTKYPDNRSHTKSVALITLKLINQFSRNAALRELCTSRSSNNALALRRAYLYHGHRNPN